MASHHMTGRSGYVIGLPVLLVTVAAGVVVAGRDLSLTGGASLNWGVLSLDGASGEANTAEPVLDTTDTFTVAAWVRPTNLGGDRAVLSQDGTSESAFRLMFRTAVNAWCFVLTGSDVPPDPPIYFACAAGPPTLGAWTHLAGVYDAPSGELRLYVDGTLAGTASFATPWLAEGAFVVGRAQKAALPRYRFSGDIADVRAWQVAVDQAGIAAMAKLPPAAGQWGMDNPSGLQAVDTSGLAAAHDANPSGGSGWAAGHSGNALTLDGTTGRLVTTGPVIRTDDSFTVSAWVRLGAKGSYSQTAVAQIGTNLSAFYLTWDVGTDRWAFTMPTPDTSGSATWQYVLSAASPPTGTWVHLLGVYDKTAATVRLYVNGVLQGTRTGVVAWNATGGLRIGDALEGSWPGFWTGDIDDVRIFRGVLSSTQITYLSAL